MRESSFVSVGGVRLGQALGTIFELPLDLGVAVRSPAASWQVLPGAVPVPADGDWVGPEGEESGPGNSFFEVGCFRGQLFMGILSRADYYNILARGPLFDRVADLGGCQVLRSPGHVYGLVGP